MNVNHNDTPPFSYFISSNTINFTSSYFEKKSIYNDVSLYHTPDLEFSLASKNNVMVAVLGLCIDLQEETLSLEKICSKLLIELSKSLVSFYDAVDYLSGRFVIIYKHNEQIYLMNDACGMLKINYDLQTHTVGSNIFLIDNIFRNSQKKFHKDYGTNAFKQGAFGDDLPLEGMKVLTPNHELNLQTFAIRRFYPRKPIEETSDIATVSSKIVEYIKVQERILSEKYQLLFSCTAGLDSRFTLAAIKSPQNHNFFVYSIFDAHVLDLFIANEISNKLNLKLFINADDKYSTFTKLMSHNIISKDNTFDIKYIDKWTWMNHGKGLLGYYKSMFAKIASEKKCLHIRSNLYEIGRVYYRKYCDNHLNILTMSGKSKLLTEEQCQHYNDFFVSTEMTSKALFGANLLDYFYWEHRMGTWIPEVLQESDFIFNTHCFVDCRKILELFLSVDFNNRKNAAVFLHTIDKLKELSEIPINPNVFKFYIDDQHKKNNNIIGYEISYIKKILSITALHSHEKINSAISIKNPESSNKQHSIYPRKNISFLEIYNEDFCPVEPTIYSINWNGVVFDLLIRRRVECETAVVWGNGALDKKRFELPIFHRHSWGEEINANGIWYFDPTCYAPHCNLGWAYGNNNRWFLRDISNLISIILSKWNIKTSDTLFFGSSGGGFTSLALACLLRGKVLCINPQIDCMKYHSFSIKNLKETCLRQDESLITSRLNAFTIMKTEKYYPNMYFIINSLSTIDMDKQLPLLISNISTKTDNFRVIVDFYQGLGGYSHQPDKQYIINVIKNILQRKIMY